MAGTNPAAAPDPDIPTTPRNRYRLPGSDFNANLASVLSPSRAKRLAVLAIAALLIVFGLILGVRSLYRMTMPTADIEEHGTERAAVGGADAGGADAGGTDTGGRGTGGRGTGGADAGGRGTGGRGTLAASSTRQKPTSDAAGVPRPQVPAAKAPAAKAPAAKGTTSQEPRKLVPINPLYVD